MKGSLTDSILTVCKTLNKFSVEYLVVGGTAVALHGHYRHSMSASGELTEKPDLDFWYNPTYENYFKLLDALENLGQDVTTFREEQRPYPKQSFFRYELEEFTLDFLPELKASLKFRFSFERRETVTLNDTTIPFINFDDLVLDKKANSRAKDQSDLEQLYIIRQRKNSN